MDLIYKSVKTVSLISLLLLGGCSTMANRHQNILPDGGPTTQEVYDGHHSGGSSDNNANDVYNIRHALQHPRDPSAWTRNASNEIHNLFPKIPNHEITGYVFPHLSPRGKPVPGYTTSFMVYQQVHYALPGEAAPLPQAANYETE